MPPDLTSRLEALDTDALAELLRRRPDVAPPGFEPNDLTELAERLAHPYSLAAAMQEQPLPTWQLVEAALALGGQPTTTDLAGFLDTDRDIIDPTIDELHDLAVLTRDGDHLHVQGALDQLFPNPLGLGASLAQLLAETTADSMRQTARDLGLPRPRTRDDATRALLAFYGDPGNIRRLLEGAPDFVRTVLQTDHDDDMYDFDPDRYAVRQETFRWAAPRGLVFRRGFSYGWQVPAEVTLALRGPGYRAPFDLRPPAVVRRQEPEGTRESAVAATEFLATLLDHLARHPAATLKTGGLGARELTKLGKTLGAGEPSVRLALELADALGLLQIVGDVTTGPAFPAWRDSAPVEQFGSAVQAWWTLDRTATTARDADAKPRRALLGRGQQRCTLCRVARQAMVAALVEVGATDRPSLAAWLAWWRPAAHQSPSDDPLADQWREAELLGVITHGAASKLGRALLAGTDATEVAQDLLPATAEHATFGSDLTVFVAGSPAARVSAVLDSAADREGRGGAITWRFTPASVRRAFDDGATADTLLAELAAVSLGELPQPLRYLVNDVARQHGTLRLSAATSVVRSDDAALLAIVAADRALAKHGVRLLAPTVLGADVPVETLVVALRSAGYFPVVDGPAADEPAANVLTPPPGVVTLPVRPQVEPDWRALAERIRVGRPAAPASTTEKVLARLNRTLSMGEVRQLAHAVDRRERIGIDYVSSTGSRTRRVIADPQLFGPSLFAWCELRQDEREFTVSRIVSVLAV